MNLMLIFLVFMRKWRLFLKRLLKNSCFAYSCVIFYFFVFVIK